MSESTAVEPLRRHRSNPCAPTWAPPNHHGGFAVQNIRELNGALHWRSGLGRLRLHSLIPSDLSLATSCSCVPAPFMELHAPQSS